MGFLDSKIKDLAHRQLLDIGDSVNFGVITVDNKLILGKQYRAGSQTETVNLFGGYVEDGEIYQDTIVRELKEETNINITDIKLINYLQKEQYVSVGYTNERSTIGMIKLNKRLDELDLKCNDENENIKIEVIEITYENINKLMDKCDCMKLFWFLNTLLLYIDVIHTKTKELIEDVNEKDIVWN